MAPKYCPVKHKLVRSKLKKKVNLNAGQRKLFTADKSTQTDNSEYQYLFIKRIQLMPQVALKEQDLGKSTTKISQNQLYGKFFTSKNLVAFDVPKCLKGRRNTSCFKSRHKNSNDGKGLSSTSSSVFSEKPNARNKTEHIKSGLKVQSIRFDINITDKNQGTSKSKRCKQDYILILRNEDYPVYLKDIKAKQDFGEKNYWESHFKSFESIGIVMTCSLDSNFTTLDIYKELCRHITDPFVLISEKSSDGFLHWHMIWLTYNNTDDAKLLLLKYIQPVSNQFSIMCQQTWRLRNLLGHILKNPICVGVNGNLNFEKYVFSILNS
ncbi:unnamed protein product [Larinioides sclopetarius]|uniref:Uncharacterized protein n=1 Tax=Larinioides sclopetarius TaxID=280406 RepID=A0AAV1ZZP3_9ARAC